MVSESRFWWDVVFWPLIHSEEYPCSSQRFPSDKTAGVFCTDNHLKRPVFAMWNMQEFGIQIEWTITATRTPLTTRSTRSTRSTRRNPTMCAVTKNTWRTREHARSVAIFVVSFCFAVVTLIPCTSHIGPRVCVSFHPMVITMSHARVKRSLWLDWPFHQLHFPPLLIIFIFQHFLQPFNFPEVK